MRPRALAILLTCVLLAASAPGARAQLLVNGNFEQGPAMSAASPVLTVAAGSTNLTGWTVGGTGVNIVTDGYWVPLSGQRSVALLNSPGHIQQSFATAPGAGYRLTFWLSGEPFSLPSLKHLRVTAGPTLADYTFDNTPAWHWDMAWQQRTLDFTASAGTTTLRFESMDGTVWGPALDSARVVLLTASVPTASGLSLSRVTPDPARGQAHVAFTLPAPGRVRLALYDLQGRERARLVDGELGAGSHTAGFDAAAWRGSPGVYLAVLDAAGERLVRRFTVLR